MHADTSERGLESLIVSAMIDRGWIAGDPTDYDREYAIDLVQLRAFLLATQREAVHRLDLLELAQPSPTRQQFLARLQGEISKRGVVDVLRNGIKHQAHSLELFYGTPSPGNATVH